jgi:hypothetical protein
MRDVEAEIVPSCGAGCIGPSGELKSMYSCTGGRARGAGGSKLRWTCICRGGGRASPVVRMTRMAQKGIAGGLGDGCDGSNDDNDEGDEGGLCSTAADIGVGVVGSAVGAFCAAAAVVAVASLLRYMITWEKLNGKNQYVYRIPPQELKE